MAYREGQKVKHFCAIPPGIRIAILPLALVIEPIHLHTMGRHQTSSLAQHGRHVSRSTSAVIQLLPSQRKISFLVLT